MYIILFKNACFEPLASKPRSARSLLAVKEIQTQRKNTKVVPLTINSRDVETLIDSAGSNGAALVGRELKALRPPHCLLMISPHYIHIYYVILRYHITL